MGLQKSLHLGPSLLLSVFICVHPWTFWSSSFVASVASECDTDRGVMDQGGSDFDDDGHSWNASTSAGIRSFSNASMSA